MITIERTDDCSLVESIVKDPRVWRRGLLHDGIPRRELWMLPPGVTCLLARKDGVPAGAYVLEEPVGKRIKAHLALLPIVWGDDSVACCQAVIQWLREHTDIEVIEAGIPEYNDLCRGLVRRIGMKLISVLQEGLHKDGTPVMTYRFELRIR